METLRLRRIQEPSRVESLLEAFIARAHILPEGAYQIRNVRELPAGLEAVVTRAIAQGQVWSCWARAAEIWLFTCDMSLPLSRERGTPVLMVRVYGEDAEVMDSGTWRYDPLGTWGRCAD
ncbi:MAG TPA: hypothetical protein VK466_06445 [Terriglobales bacterium]|nr:hypothetical protein [Terriglobales bacterium]